MVLKFYVKTLLLLIDPLYTILQKRNGKKCLGQN